MIGKRGATAVAKRLKEDDFDCVKRLIHSGGKLDYTFTDDDVYVYATARGAGDGVERLIAAVCGEED